MYRLLFVLLIAASVSAAPFFDAIYDAIAGNGRRSYGYDGYRGYDAGYRGYDAGYRGYDSGSWRPKPKQGRSFKQLCRVHYPDSFGGPGAAGVVCPY